MYATGTELDKLWLHLRAEPRDCKTLPTAKSKNCGSITGTGKFSIVQNSPDWLWGQPNLQKNGYRESFPTSWSRPLTASITEVKNEGSCTSTPSYAFIACTGSTLLYLQEFRSSNNFCEESRAMYWAQKGENKVTWWCFPSLREIC